jgi:hypothetical protein
MAQPDPRLVAALTDCDVLSQRLAARKPDVVVSATGVVGMSVRVHSVARDPSGGQLRGSWQGRVD